MIEKQIIFRKWLRHARLLASFALLGAVLVGVFTGNHEFSAIDPRVFGAGAGAAFAVFAKCIHLI
jgi:hypothetical protein